MSTTEKTEPVYDLCWVKERRRYHDGDLPARDERIDPVPSIRLAHDRVLWAIRDLDRLRPSEVMGQVRDAIRRLNDAEGAIGGDVWDRVERAKERLHVIRDLLKKDDIAKSEDELQWVWARLCEALDSLEGEGRRAPHAPEGSDSDDTPDPTVELSDTICFPMEDLQLLEVAVLEAPNRDKQYAEMLRYKITDVLRQLEEAQRQAAERLRERREKLNGGESGE